MQYDSSRLYQKHNVSGMCSLTRCVNGYVEPVMSPNTHRLGFGHGAICRDLVNVDIRILFPVSETESADLSSFASDL